jgi:hypothetical protein
MVTYTLRPSRNPIKRGRKPWISAKTKKRATVNKIIKPIDPKMDEQVEITLHDGDHLYREIRIPNAFETAKGKKVRLKDGVDVDVIVEADAADADDATPKH